MSVCMVFTKERTIDQAEMNEYAKKIRSTFEGHPVKILVNYGATEVLEGDQVEGVALLEFPTVEAAKAWYESPAYKEIVGHRFKGAKYSGVIVQGV